MTCCLPNLIEVVVLAAGAQTFLRSAGADVVAFLQTKKDILELIHPGISKEERRIICRQQWARTHPCVRALLKIPKELLANFVSSHKLSKTQPSARITCVTT
jgi:hypothetical protein